jgi:hypothetical protein
LKDERIHEIGNMLYLKRRKRETKALNDLVQKTVLSVEKPDVTSKQLIDEYAS